MKNGIVRLMQKLYLAGDNYFTAGFGGKKAARTKRKQITQKAGERATWSGKKQSEDTPFLLIYPFRPKGLEGLGRNYLVAELKTSIGRSLTRESIIGTDGCTEMLAFPNHHFEPLFFILSEQ